jgi:hypothetical protein
VAHEFEAEEPRTDLVARAANAVPFGQCLAEGFKLTEIFVRLRLVPAADRVRADVRDIRPRKPL